METVAKWYAIRVFRNRGKRVRTMLGERGIEYYSQTFLPSLIFIRTEMQRVLELRRDEWESIYVYSDMSEHGTRLPVTIPEEEFNVFRIVTSAGDTGLKFLGDNPEMYMQGDKVRVIGGPFKGAEGYIKRIKKDRRLVVTVSGVAAIATSFIPPELLEKI